MEASSACGYGRMGVKWGSGFEGKEEKYGEEEK